MTTKTISSGAKTPGVLAVILFLVGILILCYSFWIMPGHYHSGFACFGKVNDMWNNNTWMWFLSGGAILVLCIGGD